MDLTDILTYLLPLAIFVISIIAGSGNKHKKSRNINIVDDDDFDQVNFFTQRANERVNNQYEAEMFSAKNEAKPQADKKAKQQSAPIFEEGEKAIFVKEDEKVETDEKSSFDLRTAVISSAILERKF